VLTLGGEPLALSSDSSDTLESFSHSALNKELAKKKVLPKLQAALNWLEAFPEG
jgi:hypothetical protein